MKIFIDADGCPVVKQTLETAKKFDVPTVIVCDTSHSYIGYDAEVITVSKGADSADFKIVNILKSGDIVITQDYGLAAMALARGAVVLNQDGMRYDDSNIDALLLSRHTAAKIRRGGGRLRGPSKRESQQNDKFVESLLSTIKDVKSKGGILDEQ